MAKLTEYKIFRYPFDQIRESDDYLNIDILNYRPPGFGASDGFRLKSSDDPDSDLTKQIKNPVASIILPMPQDISENKGVEWGEDKMNSVAAAIAGGAADAITARKTINRIVGQVIKGAGSVKDLASGNIGESIAAGFAAQAVNQLMGQENIDPFAAVTRQTGSVLNQNQELLFRGVSLRSHSFNWTFTPRFKEEAEQVKAIIRVLKSSMSAKKQGAVADGGKGIFIQSPDVYQLAYFSGSKKHPFLNVFKICALTSINVSYTASGTYTTYADGTPIQTSMSLTFQELTPIYAEDYNTTNGEIGVGY
jgi:hypothetical protein